MPFSAYQYRRLNASPLTLQERKNRFLCLTLSYIAVFLVAGIVFLGLYIAKRVYLDTFSCLEVCGPPTIYSCGFQQCCDQENGVGSTYYFSYMYCLGDYLELIYFIVMICCFAYAAYQLTLMLCIFCTASTFKNESDVVAADYPRPQQIGLSSNYTDIYGKSNEKENKKYENEAQIVIKKM